MNKEEAMTHIQIFLDLNSRRAHQMRQAGSIHWPVVGAVHKLPRSAGTRRSCPVALG